MNLLHLFIPPVRLSHFFFFHLAMLCGLWDLRSPKGIEPGLQQFKSQVLITGLPGNAPKFSFYILAPHQPPRGSFLRAAERLFPGLSFHSVLSKLLG